jgi:hypothetical protein
VNPDYLATKPLPDGRVACVLPLFFACARLGVGPADCAGFTEVYDYDNHAAALAALERWDGTGEPAGWMRNPTTGRRRPGGDPGKEYVRR